MVTLGMDLWCFAHSKSYTKHHKSIPLVTIFLLIRAHGGSSISKVPLVNDM